MREVLAVKRRTLGAEHEETLVAARNLASTLSRHGEHSLNLDRSLSGHDKYAEAQEIQRETLRLCKRVLGAEHPGTLKAANNLATTLSRQGRHAKAKKILQAAVATCERALGPTHLTTLQYVSNLESVLAWAQIRAKLPTKAAAPVAAGSARPLAAGTRVIVQRLVTKPEHNSKRARVLAFDARSERYVVVLDNGKELSLKPECVASAQCARCASERRAACAHGASRCGTAVASASGRTGRCTNQRAPPMQPCREQSDPGEGPGLLLLQSLLDLGFQDSRLRGRKLSSDILPQGVRL